MFLDPSLEIGRRIASSSTWLHALLIDGNNIGIDETTYRGSRFELGAGIEERPCVAGGVLCATVGADLAVRHTRYEAEYDRVAIDDIVAIEHAGLDLGSRRVRFRAGLDLVSEPVRVFAGAALSATLAFAW
jgi:hypothetical protein